MSCGAQTGGRFHPHRFPFLTICSLVDRLFDEKRAQQQMSRSCNHHAIHHIQSYATEDNRSGESTGLSQVKGRQGTTTDQHSPP